MNKKNFIQEVIEINQMYDGTVEITQEISTKIKHIEMIKYQPESDSEFRINGKFKTKNFNDYLIKQFNKGFNEIA